MATWKEHLKAQQYTDEEISNMEKTFGADKMAKAFEGPIQAAEKAAADAAQAKKDLEEFTNNYQTNVLPEVSKAFQDAINTRTQNAALLERLKAAKDYGFLSDENAIPGSPAGIPGVPAGTPARADGNAVPGSPALDPRYVRAEDFTKGVNEIPDMLGRLTKMSNEHFHLFGAPLLDVDELINEARTKKRNVVDIWNEKYKVADKRKELADKKQAEHDKQVGEKYVADYLAQHGGTPFTRPAMSSISTRFTSANKDEVRQPWKGARERQAERHDTMLNAWAKGKAGTVNSVQ